MKEKKSISLLLAVMFLCGISQAQPTQVAIDRNTGLTRVTVQGETNRDYKLFASDLSSSNWNFLSTLALTNASQSWLDSASPLLSKRFYRAEKLDPAVAPVADDFRLIDHQGISRSLYYYQNATNVKAFVLIFTGNSCTNVQQMVSRIKSLRDQYTPLGVTFWMIDSNPSDNRSNIVTEANALGIDLPILHDRAQLVARAYQASSTPEVVCVNKVGWQIFYRGTVDDRMGSGTNSTTQHYLANALSSFLANKTVTPRATQTNGCAILLPTIPTPSYSTDIAPLLLDKCVRCHSPGNIAPFDMTNHATVTNMALQMRTEVLANRMPPWHADPFYQSFTNDGSLTPTEAQKLVKWIDDGAPRGGGPDPLTTASPNTNYPFAWPASLGAPSNTITITPQSIPASGTIDYRKAYWTNTGPSVWLRAAVLLPGTVPVVHHILAYKRGDNGAQTFLTGYVPGSYLGAFPTNTGKLLTNGTVLEFQMHYIPIGYITNDTSQLGLYTTPAAPAFPLIQTSAWNPLFSISPNTNNYQFIATNGPFTTNIYIYEMSPHMHTRGAGFKYEAIYTNGTTEVLLSVPRYEFHWQTAYRFAQPKYLPKGTKMRCTAMWDNSILNNDLMNAYIDYSTTPPTTNSLYAPTNTVHWGDQTWDEMFIGYFNYTETP